MAQNQTLPLGSGLGAIRAPSLQGDANEAAFRRDASSGGLLGDLLRGIGFQNNSADQESITKILTSSPAFNLSDTQAVGGIGLSQVPASGLPDILPSETNIFGDDSDGFKIQTKRGPETISEFAASNLAGFYEMFKPTPEDARRLARARGQVIPGEADEIEAMSIRDASDARTRGGSFGSTVDDAAGQLAGGQETSRILAEAQAGKTFGDKPENTEAPLPQELTTGEMSGSVKGANTPAKQATVIALDEYLKLARPGVKPKDYKEYMKEFADATGLDVSGEADNRAALMAFGLALMQNKAGKGFDVGKMLSSVGEAGEKALPALEKARSEAKAIRAKAGEYALSRKKEDQAAAMNREDFYIIPKGKLGGPLGVVDAITKGKGRFERLNSYELNNLDTNEEFNSQYEIVKASDYNDLAKEALKAPEVKDLYQTGSKTIALFDGAPKDIGLMVQLPDLNNPKARGMIPGVQGGAAESIQYVRDMEKDLGKQKEFFGGIAGLLNRTGTGAVEQTRSMIVQGLRNLGLDAGGETDPIKQIQVMLTELKAKNAAQILGESGKTLSDNDRAMVAEIVGGISFTEGDEALLVQKLGRLYDAVVGKSEQNLNQAYRTLDSYGVKYGNSKRDTGVRKGKDDQGEYIDLTSQ